jgi:hypothetical protein
MNTLSRTKTVQILGSSTTYHQIRQQWRALINSDRKHELSAAHHLLYLALIGKDWRKSFTPPTNQRKIENGAFTGWAMFRAMSALHSPRLESELLAPFAGNVTLEMLQHIRQLISIRNVYSYKAEQFAGHAFPFDAYIDQEIAHA